jgi:peptide deformylase
VIYSNRENEMSILKIVSFPDPVLAKVGEPVVEFNDGLKELAEDMFETMYAAEGVGLAAQQIGHALQLFVMDCEGTKIVAANPEIISEDGEQLGDEACLSLSSIGMPLNRAAVVRMRAQDVNGDFYEIEGTGLTARCLQHETGHLNGHLFIDYLSPLKREMLLKKFRKARKWEQTET